MASRAKPNVVSIHNVCNQSSRNAAAIKLLVVHDTESHNRPGNADLEAIAAHFDNPDVQASAHVCTDGDGNSARYVADTRKAWHVANFNSVSLGVEQIGFASDPEAGWFARRKELEETARWLALWSWQHGVPLRKGRVRGINVLRTGVVRHSELGALGGGHSDPGSFYPLRYVLARARLFKRALKK